MPSLDTNVLLRWLIQDVPEQTAQVDDLLARGGRFRVDDVAIVETVFVLERVMKLSRRTVGDSLEVLISTACLDFDRRLWNEIAQGYVAHPKVSVAEIFLALRARDGGAAPLLTFDQKLAGQVDGAALLT